MLIAQEILEMPLNAALVALSACDTGQALLTVKQNYDDPKSWSGFTLVGEAQ